MAGGGERTPPESDGTGTGEGSGTRPEESNRSSEDEIDRYIEQVGRFIPRVPSPASQTEERSEDGETP